MSVLFVGTSFSTSLRWTSASLAETSRIWIEFLFSGKIRPATEMVMTVPRNRRHLESFAFTLLALLGGCVAASQDRPTIQPSATDERRQIVLRCRCVAERGQWFLYYRVVNIGQSPVFIYEQLPIHWTLHGLDASGKEVVWGFGGSPVYGSSGYPSKYLLVRGAKEHVAETYTYLSRRETLLSDSDLNEKMDPARSYIECKVSVSAPRCASAKRDNIELTCHAAIPGAPADAPP